MPHIPSPAPKPEKKRKSAKPKKPKIKKLDPDFFFSLCVRESTNWTCCNCGKKYDWWMGVSGYPANPALHASHFVGRKNYAVRFEKINVDPHCYYCHVTFEGNPHLFREWKLKQLGQTLYDILIEKSNNLMLGKQARKEKQAIAEHYKREFEVMQTFRNKGHTGKLDFQGYF